MPPQWGPMSAVMRLPDFLVIGAPRSGTTSLHYALAEHPGIFMSPEKETDFFLRSPHGGLPSWTSHPDRVPRDLLEYAALFNGAQPDQIIGEASPGYLWGPCSVNIEAAYREAGFSQPKLIAVLRQPVDQALSIMTTWLGHQPTMAELGDELLTDDRLGPDQQMPLVWHGRYWNHLRPYFDRWPHELIMVMLLDDLEERPLSTMRDLQRFIGVEPVNLELRRFNSSGHQPDMLMRTAVRAKGFARAVLPAPLMRRLRPLAHRVMERTVEVPDGVPPGLRAEWTEQFYGDDIGKLEAMIGRDLSHWRAPPAHHQARAVAAR